MKSLWILTLAMFSLAVSAHQLPTLIPQIKPSVVAIALYNPTAAPRLKLIGSGFAVSPGNQIVTNHHVVSKAPDESKNERYVVLSGHGQNPTIHPIVARKDDPIHDLAVLKIAESLPALKLAEDETAEGTLLAFTGYPITGVLGLYPATHQATLSAITPVAIPQDNSKLLNPATLRQLQQPFMVYQLDGTAYPGNSGSALYRQADGAVVAVINMVLVKGSREAVLSDPSGIAYAIPIVHLQKLLAQPYCRNS
jgi:S1-C subfamily serine protease